MFDVIHRTYAQGVAEAAATAADDTISSLLLAVINGLASILIALLVMLASFIVARLLGGYIVSKLHDAQGETLHEDVVILVRRMVTVAVVAIGMGVAFQYVLKLDILQIVGFFGLGIGFAFKDILSNLLAGVIVLMQGRFHIGDNIQIGGVKGKVVEIQTRATILRGFDGTEIIIPNSDFLSKTVRTFTTNPTRRIMLDVPVHLRTNIDLALALMKEVLVSHSDILKKPQAKVHASGFGEGCIVLKAKFWIAPKLTPSWVKVRSDVLRSIKARFEKHGIEIPFPIYQDYVVEGDDIAKQGKEWKNMDHPLSDSLDKLIDGPVVEGGEAR